MIRYYEPSDTDQIISIWLAASIEAHDFVKKEFWESKVADMRDVYLPASETYVYEDNGIIKGFVSLHGDTLAAIFVSPGEQGKGIGQQLMAKSKGVRRNLSLTVYKANRKSVEFHKKCGFKTMKEQVDEHTGHPELVMEFKP
jgi:putative acetyltransferase